MLRLATPFPADRACDDTLTLTTACPPASSDWWFKLPAAFVDGGELAAFKTLATLKVELALRRHADAEGVARPSLATLAEETGMSRGNVSRAIRDLVKGRRVERIEAGTRNGRATRYRLMRSVPGATPVASPAQQGGGPGATGVASPAQQGGVPGAAPTDTRTDTSGQTHLNSTDTPKRRAKAPRPPVTLADLPEPIRTEAVLASWAEFEQHRRQLGKPLTPLAVQKQLKELARWGPDRAVAAIDHSITKNWLSIHEPNGGTHAQGNGRNGIGHRGTSEGLGFA